MELEYFGLLEKVEGSCGIERTVEDLCRSRITSIKALASRANKQTDLRSSSNLAK